MLNIVVYGRSGSFMTKNIDYIRLSLLGYDIKYHIYEYEKYCNELDTIIRSNGKKIYLLDVDFDNRIAFKIREYDYDSIIIMVSSKNNYEKDIFNTRLMVLDFLYFDNNYKERFIDDMKIAISIIDKHRVFTFKYNRIVYRIPVNEITYIEKEPEIKRCIIHTINNKYCITGTLCFILSQLDDSFVRTHQSCIVNLNNIKKIDLSNNVIIFKNDDKTDMLNIKMKREIKNLVGIS